MEITDKNVIAFHSFYLRSNIIYNITSPLNMPQFEIYPYRSSVSGFTMDDGIFTCNRYKRTKFDHRDEGPRQHRLLAAGFVNMFSCEMCTRESQ